MPIQDCFFYEMGKIYIIDNFYGSCINIDEDKLPLRVSYIFLD